MIKGGCLCSAIHYEVKELEGALGHRYCNFCRKDFSTTFSLNLTAVKGNFTLVAGQDFLNFCKYSPGKKDVFLQNATALCGSQKKILLMY